MSWNGDGLPTTGGLHSRVPLCGGHWYLDAVLGCDLHDPPHVWLALKDQRPMISTVHRLFHLLEEALVQAPRCLGYQHPAYAVIDVLVGMQGAFRDVEKGACTHPEALLAA